MRERNFYLFEIWKRTGDRGDWVDYRKQSNYLVRVLRQKKAVYFSAQLRSTVQSQDMWKSARSQLKFTTSGAPTALSVNGELTSDPQKMAEAQQDFFVTKVVNIKAGILKSNVDPLSG